MEESYQILNNGQKNHYVVVHKDHPGFLANVSFTDNKVNIIKITLMEACELSVLTKALNDIGHYFKGEKLKALLEAQK